MDCCQIKDHKKKQKCVRSDGKEFEFPRRISPEKCKKGPVRGFTMRSSCAPYKFCKIAKKEKLKKKSKKTKILGKKTKILGKKTKILGKKLKKKGGGEKNMLGKTLRVCSTKPLTGYYRNGYCSSGPDDIGKHLVCAKITQKFLNFSSERGNDLSSVVKPGEKWCLCESRWLEAEKAGKAPPVIKSSTHQNILSNTKRKITNKKKRTSRRPNNK